MLTLSRYSLKYVLLNLCCVGSEWKGLITEVHLTYQLAVEFRMFKFTHLIAIA